MNDYLNSLRLFKNNLASLIKNNVTLFTFCCVIYISLFVFLGLIFFEGINNNVPLIYKEPDITLIKEDLSLDTINKLYKDTSEINKLNNSPAFVFLFFIIGIIISLFVFLFIANNMYITISVISLIISILMIFVFEKFINLSKNLINFTQNLKNNVNETSLQKIINTLNKLDKVRNLKLDEECNN